MKYQNDIRAPARALGLPGIARHRCRERSESPGERSRSVGAESIPYDRDSSVSALRLQARKVLATPLSAKVLL